MPREVKQRKASRQEVAVNDTPRGLNVVASQNVVAEQSSFERLAGALGTAKPLINNLTQQYNEGERERLDLEGKKFGLDVTNEMHEIYNREWQNRDDASEQIDAYFNDSLAKLPDNQMRKAALSYMMRARADLHGKHNDFLLQQDKVRKVDALSAVFDDTAVNGGGLGKNGMAHFLEYARTQNLTDREAGAIAMERAILHANETGDTSILKAVEGHVVDDVPLGTVYKEQAMKAHAAAATRQAKDWTMAAARERTRLEQKADSGNFGSDQDLQDAKAVGLTLKEVTSLMTRQNTKLVDQLEVQAGVEAYITDRTAPSDNPTRLWDSLDPKVKTKAAKALFTEAERSGDVEELLRIANTTGETYEPWKFRLNQRSLETKATWNGEVPQQFLQDHSLYQTLRTSTPNALSNHLTNPKSEEFHKAYDFSRQRGRTEVEAYSTALQLVNSPFDAADFPHVDFRAVGKEVDSVVSSGFDAENNLSYISTWMRTAAKQNVRLGAGEEASTADLEEEFKRRHVKINDTWVPTYGKPVSADTTDVVEYAVENHISELIRQDKLAGAEGIEYDPNDFYAIPDPTGSEGVWIVMEKPQHVTGTKFDINSMRQQRDAIRNPRLTPEDFSGAPAGDQKGKKASRTGSRDPFIHLEPADAVTLSDTMEKLVEVQSPVINHMIKAIQSTNTMIDTVGTLFGSLQDKSGRGSTRPERGGSVRKTEPLPEAQPRDQEVVKAEPVVHSDIRSRIRDHEGFKAVSYPDADGRSVGNGIFLGKPGNPPKHVKDAIEAAGYDFDDVYQGKVAINDQLAEELFNVAYDNAAKQSRQLVSNYDELPAPIRGVLIEMVYQMGIGNPEKQSGVMGFSNFRKALEAKEFDTAVKEMLNSKWAKEDTPGRALSLARIVRNS